MEIEMLDSSRFSRIAPRCDTSRFVASSARQFLNSRSVVIALAWLAGCSAVAPKSETQTNVVHELAQELRATKFELRELWRGGTNLDARTAVVAIGDENGDGVRELALYSGFLDETTRAKGVARVLDGASGALRREHVGIGGEIRVVVVCLRDVDGDGIDELALAECSRGVFLEDFWQGPILVRAGTSRALATRDFLFIHDVPVMVALGDLDGDGINDLGTIERIDFARRGLNLVSGATLSTIAAPQDVQTLPDLGGDLENAFAAAGDVDGDGCADFVLVDAQEMLRLISGKTRSTMWSVPLSDPDYWRISGPITLGPDLDRDGARDLLATAWFPSKPNLGANRLEMISARTGTRTTLRVLDGASDEHTSLAVLDDLDHDGVNDLALGIVGTSQSTIELWSLGRSRSLARFEVPCAGPLLVLQSSPDRSILATPGRLGDAADFGVIAYEIFARR